MIKITVLYPHVDGSRFDLDYYCRRHVPRALHLMEGKCRGFSVERGLPDPRDGSPPPYEVISSLLFDSVEAYASIPAEVQAQMSADLRNFTRARPLIQISEVVASE